MSGVGALLARDCAGFDRVPTANGCLLGSHVVTTGESCAERLLMR